MQTSKHRQGRATAAMRGFTLLELILVLALVAILAAAGALNYRRMRASVQLTAAARQVAMDLGLARVRAVSGNANYRIVFPEGAVAYRRQRKDSVVYSDDGGPVTLPAGTMISACTASDAAIMFRPRGNAGSFGTVTLQNVDGDVRRVVVDIAGHVRVQ